MFFYLNFHYFSSLLVLCVASSDLLLYGELKNLRCFLYFCVYMCLVMCEFSLHLLVWYNTLKFSNQWKRELNVFLIIFFYIEFFLPFFIPYIYFNSLMFMGRWKTYFLVFFSFHWIVCFLFFLYFIRLPQRWFYFVYMKFSFIVWIAILAICYWYSTIWSFLVFIFLNSFRFYFQFMLLLLFFYFVTLCIYYIYILWKKIGCTGFFFFPIQIIDNGY